MKVRGTALVHFTYESVDCLPDDEIRQAIVDSIGTQTATWEGGKIETEALMLEDVTVDRGVDA